MPFPADFPVFKYKIILDKIKPLKNNKKPLLLQRLFLMPAIKLSTGFGWVFIVTAGKVHDNFSF